MSRCYRLQNTKLTTMAKVEIISTETIKPSSPTPHHMKTFKLSLLDQLSPSIYNNLLLFYSKPNIEQKAKAVALRSSQLKLSLSETLTLLYPLAGRFIKNVAIDCNDEGVIYIDSHVHCDLNDILKDPKVDDLKKLLPTHHIQSEELTKGFPSYIQANLFNCGGLAIGFCASHKITDAATLSILVKVWAATSRGGETGGDILFGTSLFPPNDLLTSSPVVKPNPQAIVTKRFVFDGSSIKTLKAQTGNNSTRVEVVSAVIWKSAMAASRLNSASNERISILTHAVNLRKRLVPPLPENTVGNIVSYFRVEKDEAAEVELSDLIDKIKKSSMEFSNNFVKKLQGDEGVSVILDSMKKVGNMISKHDFDLYSVSSWCRIGLYDADFGWGKPLWVSVANSLFTNVALLMDTKDGEGIEAWVTLKEKDMVVFEQDQKLLTFASLNPSVSHCL